MLVIVLAGRVYSVADDHQAATENSPGGRSCPSNGYPNGSLRRSKPPARVDSTLSTSPV